MIRARLLRLALLVLAASFVAACDKCGHPVKLNAPSLPKACGDNVDPSRG